MRSSLDRQISVKEYVALRNKMLLKRDPKEFKKFAKEFNQPYPRSLSVLEQSMHMAITAAMGLPKKFRQESKDWLSARGMKSLDDGDLK